MSHNKLGPQLPSTMRRVYLVDDVEPGTLTEVGLDTSFVVALLSPTDRHHAPCLAAWEEWIKHGATVVFNRLLEVELSEISFREGVKKHTGEGWRSGRRHSALPAGTASMETQSIQWRHGLQRISHIRVELEEVADESSYFMTAYGLSSHDAVHAATALRARNRAIVTLDRDFAQVYETVLSIITVPGRHVADMRRHRAGARRRVLRQRLRHERP